MATNSSHYTVRDLRRFFYLSSICKTADETKSNSHLSNMLTGVLRSPNGATDIFKEIVDFSSSNNMSNLNRSIDSLCYALAFIVKSRIDHKTTNNAYNTLKDISDTPIHLFAFIHYHKCLLDEERATNRTTGGERLGKGWGKGQRKAVIRWYNGRSEEDVLRLVTKYRHSHDWSNKDVIKMARIKACSDGMQLIFRYLLFGYDKIKNDKLKECDKALFEFIADFENLKTIASPVDAAVLIRKHKFHLEHLPLKLQKQSEIWEALIEDMQIKEFCQYIGLLTSKRLLQSNTPSQKYVLERILSKEQIQLQKTHPIYPALALRIYSKINQQQSDQVDMMEDALFNSFELSANIQNLSSNKRILCAIETNSLIKGTQTDGLKFLSPIDTILSIVLTLKYTEDTCDLVLITDKLNQVQDLPTKQQALNFNHLSSLFERYTPVDKNPNEQAIQVGKDYDVFIYFILSNYNEQLLIDSMNTYRLSQRPNAKLIVIRLQGQINLPHDEVNMGSNLNLFFAGWSMDSYNVMRAFLNDLF